MKSKLIACDIMCEEVDAICAELGVTAAAYDTDPLEMGLHDQPEKLKADLARRMEALRDAPYDAILLGLGLCQNSVAGLEAPGIPLVIPRMHDCIALFLGSHRLYKEEHGQHPGTYWYARGFLHRKNCCEAAGLDGPEKAAAGLAGMGTAGLMGAADGAGPSAGQPAPDQQEEQYQRWVEEFGEENARYLVEELHNAWKRNYTRAVYLAWEGDPCRTADRERIRRHAADNHWAFAEYPVDLRLLRGLLDGSWRQRPDEYLVVLPGQVLQASHDDGVMKAIAARDA